MGEYANRKSDNERIKIGTCEDMYYLRYEDRAKVRKEPNSLDPAQELNLRFRLPFPDEDNVRPGEYDKYNRGERLWRTVETPGTQPDRHIDADSELFTEAPDPGTIQLTHPSGLLLNVPCYHGTKLPEVGPGMKAFWNGKSWCLELGSIKNTADAGVKPIVRCRHCDQAWRFDWSDVMPFLHGEMKERLEQYAQREREAVADEVCGNNFVHLHAV